MDGVKIIKGYYKRKYKTLVLMILSITLIATAANVISSNFPSNVHMPGTNLIVFGDDNYKVSAETINQKQTPAMNDTNFRKNYGYDATIDFDIDVETILRPHSQRIYDDILNTAGNLIVMPNTYDQELTYNIPNYTLGVNQMVVGSLPTKDDQIAINEILAQSYANKLNIKSINNLLGENIVLEINGKQSTFKISGVYGGDYTSVITPNEFSKLGSKYKLGVNTLFEFTSKQAKEQFIANNKLTPDDYIDSSYNTPNYKMIVFIIAFVLCGIIFILSNIELGADVSILKYYFSNKLILLYILQPILLTSISIIIGINLANIF